MKKYEIIIEDEGATTLTALLQTLSYVKQVKETDVIDPYTLISEEALSEDWLVEEDDELQKMYMK